MARPAVQSLDTYLTVKEAARLLGVSASTLRNWDRQGKVVASRHPVNSYRLYQKERLLAFLVAVGETHDHGNAKVPGNGSVTQRERPRQRGARPKHAQRSRR